MKQDDNKIKYFLYARRSSEESSDRQVQSIDDQVDRMKKLAKTLGLHIEHVYTESKSAKKPNNRPVFTEMMERIENGEASGIICWKLDRLFRNPIDFGRISWGLQQGVIKCIQTNERPYKPEDNVLLMSVEGGMANQYVLDLSKNVKRGVEKKRNDGWLPNLPPEGYLNDPATRTIIKDKERFNLIRKMWDLMLTGNYTPPKILVIANNDWGFKTRKFKRSGGKELAKSSIYRMFTNVFYAGIISSRNGKEYDGKHDPMVTLEEFERVQILLGRKGKPRPKKHEFAFTGSMRCEECGCLYTAETKKKLIRGTGEIRLHTYYHCTGKKRHYKCSQTKWLKIEDLENQIEQELESLTILPEFRDWALVYLRENNNTEIEDRTKIYDMQHDSVVKTQKQLDNLTRMRYSDMIDDETFEREKKSLQSSIKQLTQKLHETEARAEHWLELTEKTFNFATYARNAFIKGDMQTKKEILLALGQNPTIKDGKINIRANDWLIPIKNEHDFLKANFKGSEPMNFCLDKRKTDALASVRLHLSGRRDSNPV